MSIRAVPIGELVDPVKTWSPGTIPDEMFEYVDLSAIDQNEKKIQGTTVVRGSEAPSRARQIIRKGDILVSTVRPNLNSVAVVDEYFDGATASTGFCVLRSRDRHLVSDYLGHWVRSPAFIDLMVREATGASYPAVSDRIVKSSLIPLPSLDDQRRIATILDKADALRRKRKRALNLLNGLTQSIFREMFGDLIESSVYPRGTIFDWVSDFDTGKNLAPDPNTQQNDGYRVLKVSAVTTGIFLPEESKPLPIAYEPPATHLVQKGDLLFTRANTSELVGATAYVEASIEKLVLPDKIWRFVWRRANEPHPRFIQTLFSTASFRREISKRATGTSGSMKNISKEKVFRIHVAQPSRKLQDDFAERLVPVNRTIEAAAKQSRVLEDHFSSLQHRAFSGQL